MSDIDTDLPVVDELTALKARADMMGVKYHPSISLEKLKEKITAHMNAEESKSDAAPELDRAALQRNASELMRIRVTCMNPAKKEWEGEIFTVGNSVVGTFKKYVPFNADEGWHVPRIIYEQLKDRECQVFTTVRDARGNSTRKGKLIKEFAIEVLPNLTEEEIKELAQRQAMAKSVGWLVRTQVNRTYDRTDYAYYVRRPYHCYGRR